MSEGPAPTRPKRPLIVLGVVLAAVIAVRAGMAATIGQEAWVAGLGAILVVVVATAVVWAVQRRRLKTREARQARAG